MLADTWFEYNHRTYYLTESGAAAKGWVELDGKWYYFDRNNGDMKRGTTIDGYTLNDEGVYVKQSHQLNVFLNTNRIYVGFCANRIQGKGQRAMC